MKTSGSVRVRSGSVGVMRLKIGAAASMLATQISERNLFGRTDCAIEM